MNKPAYYRKASARPYWRGYLTALEDTYRLTVEERAAMALHVSRALDESNAYDAWQQSQTQGTQVDA